MVEKITVVEVHPSFQKYREFVNSLDATAEKDLRIRLDHAITGCVTESGELMGLMKKIKFYDNVKIPRIKFLDELGDLFWYFTLALNTFDVSLEDIIRLNTTKLKARHINGVTTESLLHENEVKEQEAIQSLNNTNEEIK
jgi:NTP pyrophosphatase (non-canonical NTP hydrolase)